MVRKKAAMIFVLKVKCSWSHWMFDSVMLILDGSRGGYEQSGQGGQEGYVQVTAEPSELTVGRGERAVIACNVQGARTFTVKWGKYAHDTGLPNYMRVCIL